MWAFRSNQSKTIRMNGLPATGQEAFRSNQFKAYDTFPINGLIQLLIDTMQVQKCLVIYVEFNVYHTNMPISDIYSTIHSTYLHLGWCKHRSRGISPYLGHIEDTLKTCNLWINADIPYTHGLWYIQDVHDSSMPR